MLITYNHEKYIAQALESILMQETEYDYEIAVIEDCSTDGTREIIKQYAEKYPNKVKPYFNEKNIGYKITQKNFYQGFFRLTGDYIAILEGDDYWSSQHKLQKQVSFLEANPEYVGCAHNTIKIYEDGSREPHRFLYYPNLPREHTVHDFIMLSPYFHTTTLLYRNVFRGKPPRQFQNKWSCDIFITIAHAQFGKIYYFDEDMACYRAHGGGRFSNMPMLEGWFFNIGGLRRYNQWLGYRYLKTFSRSIIRYCNNVLNDKGKEAEKLKWYQYIKYLGIKTVYQFIYVVLCLKDIPAAIPKCRIRMRSYWEEFQKEYRKNRRPKTLIRPLQHAGEAILRGQYRIANALLPDSIKNNIRNYEAVHPEIRTLRQLLIEGRLISNVGIRTLGIFLRNIWGIKRRNNIPQ